MSTTGPVDPHSQPFRVDPVADSSAPGPGAAIPPGIDAQLIQQTKNEIRNLVHEIARLAQSDITPDRFYEGFLRRVVQALASHGGAVWSVTDGDQLKLEYQINMPAEELIDDPAGRKRHGMLLKNVLESRQPTLVPPKSGASEGDEAGNPTDFLLVLATVGVEEETRGIVEIFQRPGGGPTTQRGYLRFLLQMSDLVGDYLKSRRLRHLGNRQSLWEHLEQFLGSIHRTLDVKETGYTLVNESRRLVGCDRVSLTVSKGRQQSVVAVSGLDSLDRRADQVKQLTKLANAVSRGKRPVWYIGGETELPPQIDEPLQEYVDQSHATLLAAVPLYGLQDDEESDQSERSPVGTLIVEQLEDTEFHDGFRERVETVARHGGMAFANALEHQSLFLLPVWKFLGKARVIVSARNLPKTIAAALVCLAVFLGLALAPAAFDLSANGHLQPEVRQDIFAHIDGVVVDVPARHEQPVERGAVLVKLSNNSLDVEIANLIGRKRATEERIRSVKRSQLNARLRLEEQNRLDGELLELIQVNLSIDRELALLQQKEEQLVIRSPMAGRVVTWNVHEILQGRPVRIGQTLMTVVDPTGDWELEVFMPERKMGHLLRASEKTEFIPVTFILASHPEVEFSGQVVEISRVSQNSGNSGNTVRLRVAIEKEALPDLRTGTTVTAKVHCGDRSIGFVLFHELAETVQRNILFWF